MILVTGGTGFLGSRITHALLARGESVVCFDARPDATHLEDDASHRNLSIIQGDISRFDDLIGAMRLHGVDRIIHTAALLRRPIEADPRLAIRVNVVGTNNVFDAARLLDATRVVYASTMVVYGRQVDHGPNVVDEDSPLHPPTVYGHTKRLNEMLGDSYRAQFGIECCGLRVCSPFGHRGAAIDTGGEVTRLIALPAAQRPVRIRLGRHERPPSAYVDDVAEIFVRLCLAEVLPHSLYLCSATCASLEEIACMVVAYLPDADIAFEDPGEELPLVHRLDTRRLEAAIGYRLPPLETRVRDYINIVRRAHALPEVGPL